MSNFDHVTVADIEEYTATVRAEWEQQVSDELASEFMRDVVAETSVVDGIPTCKEVAEFCAKVRAANPQVRFGITQRSRKQWFGNVRRMSEMWMYFPGDVYAPMRIGYFDYSIRGGTGTKVYGVYARTITNAKFAERRQQHNMVISEGLGRAVTASKKHLRRYKAGEIAAMSYDFVRSYIASLTYTVNGDYREAFSAVSNDNNFVLEMQHILDGGSGFLTPEFANKVKAMVEANKTKKDNHNAVYHGWHVMVRVVNDTQSFDVTRVTDLQSYRRADEQLFRNTETVAAEALPETIAEKLASLSMLQSGTFMEGLGYKVSDACYWVIE